MYHTDFAYRERKKLLTPLPDGTIRSFYRMPSSHVKVNSQGMISFKSKLYSVPMRYASKMLTVWLNGDILHVYDNTELVTVHMISDQRRNYHAEHYIETLKNTFSNKTEQEIEEIALNNLKQIGDIYE